MAKNNFLIETFITDKNKSLDTYKKGLLLRTNQILSKSGVWFTLLCITTNC